MGEKRGPDIGCKPHNNATINNLRCYCHQTDKTWIRLHLVRLVIWHSRYATCRHLINLYRISSVMRWRFYIPFQKQSKILDASQGGYRCYGIVLERKNIREKKYFNDLYTSSHSKKGKNVFFFYIFQWIIEISCEIKTDNLTDSNSDIITFDFSVSWIDFILLLIKKINLFGYKFNDITNSTNVTLLMHATSRSPVGILSNQISWDLVIKMKLQAIVQLQTQLSQ